MNLINKSFYYVCLLSSGLFLTSVLSKAQSTTNPSQSTTTTVKSSNQIIAPPRKNIPGQRFTLSTGQLFIPDYYQNPKDGKIDLVVFFHGAAWMSEQNLYQSGANVILHSISMNSYPDYFQDTTRFGDLLNEIRWTLDTTGILTNAQIRHLCLASFSGGYSAIREILKTPAYFHQITDMYLADSLYAGFTDTTRTTLIEEQMLPFLNYCKEAVKGTKSFWFTQLYPPEEKYRDNTTTRTAEYLMKHLDAAKIERNEINSLGMVLLYSSDTGKFHIRGYAGMTNQDHFNHFYNMVEYLQKVSGGWMENSRE